MTEALFGAPTGLLQRLNRSEVRVPDVRAAVDRLVAGGAAAGLRVGVVDGPRGPLLAIDEHGRSTRVQLGELAVEMSRARVPSAPAGVTAALAAWLVRRPVPDRVAAEQGIAVLDWTDRRQTALAWRVVVVREDVVVPWRPSRTATLPGVHETRAQALDRSAETPGELLVEGPVGLWTADTTGTDSAVLARPEALLARLARRGLPLRDPHLVVTPHRPVACADASVARRLVAEATDTCVVLPWRAVADLGWA